MFRKERRAGRGQRQRILTIEKNELDVKVKGKIVIFGLRFNRQNRKESLKKNNGVLIPNWKFRIGQFV